ncbi:hypothetical protein BCR44DRAFT_334107 [Catenaria anguillulae PL171]|uniref:B30.2/SPRY domain-containing protein n=1 Tax=Catenaria anguillulae PL171 TaxID=765915 RepID=A0A1Y2HC51_9FUNG|nr:hypothetical protein BCR44DRAFT_334107 [Catenaria anguillulae PL171]
MFITNTRADDLLSLGADFLDPYVSSFSLCTSNLANGSLSTILFANDSMAKELISSGRMRQLVTDQAVVSNLELLGALQCALTSANPEFFDDIRDQLKDTGFIQLGYDHLDQVQSTPVAMPFLLTFDPDARGKLLDLYIQQCATVAPDLAASTIDDPAAFREFLTAICSFLFVSKPSDELQVRERLIREGDLLDILRISALEPSLRGYPIIFHVVDALCYDEALIPTVVAAFHLPLLSHWHSSILELISATKEILVTVRKQSVPVDDHSIMAAEELLVSTLVWFHHSFLRSLNPQVVQVLVEQQDGGLLQAVDCLKQLLELNVLDSKQRPYYSQDNPRALDLYYATNDSVGNEWSDALDEANAYISFNETHNVIYSIVSATCTALSHLSHFGMVSILVKHVHCQFGAMSDHTSSDLLRPRCLDILPLLPGILFNRGQNIRFFYQTALQAPLKVLDQYYKTLSFHYRVAAEQKYPVKSKDALAMLEGMNRVFVRNSTVDSVHWASMTGGVQTCARGSTVFNFSAHQQQVRGSHGVTGKGKYCYTVSFPEKAGITLGWTTNAGPLVWNQNLYMQEPTSNGEGAPQTVVINFEVAAAWKSGKFRNSVDYATANSFITCILDLDNGQFIYGVDQLPFRVVFSNLDRSQTWFPVIYPMSRSVIETNFSESIRESSGIPLGSAPISDLIRHPDARSPIPTASDSTDARREYLPITVDGLPLTPKALSKLVLRNYYETELTPSFTDPLLAVGFRQGLTYTLWVSTRQIELALQFALDDHVTAVEHSAQWCTWIPALIKYFGQNRSVSPPEAAFGVMFAEDGSVAGLVDVGSNDTAQAQIVVCGYAVREGCDLDSVEPTCSSPINFGVAILLDKKGSRLFTVTKGLAPIVKEGMFPLLLADGEEDFFTPLIINAFGVTLQVHMDVEAKEPWKLKGPLLQGRSDDDLVVWYENMETRR